MKIRTQTPNGLTVKIICFLFLFEWRIAIDLAFINKELCLTTSTILSTASCCRVPRTFCVQAWIYKAIPETSTNQKIKIMIKIGSLITEIAYDPSTMHLRRFYSYSFCNDSFHIRTSMAIRNLFNYGALLIKVTWSPVESIIG